MSNNGVHHTLATGNFSNQSSLANDINQDRTSVTSASGYKIMSLLRACVVGVILGCSIYAFFLLVYKQVNSDTLGHFKEVRQCSNLTLAAGKSSI